MGSQFAGTGGRALCSQRNVRGSAVQYQRNVGVALLPPKSPLAGGDQPFDSTQGRAKPRVAAATQKPLGRHMKGRPKCWPCRGRGLHPLGSGVRSKAPASIWADRPATVSGLRTSADDEKIPKCIAAFPGRARLCVDVIWGLSRKKRGGNAANSATKKRTAARGSKREMVLVTSGHSACN